MLFREEMEEMEEMAVEMAAEMVAVISVEVMAVAVETSRLRIKDCDQGMWSGEMMDMTLVSVFCIDLSIEEFYTNVKPRHKYPRSAPDRWKLYGR